MRFFESLESRRLLSAGATLGALGELKVVGTSGPDVLSVEVSGSNIEAMDGSTVLLSVAASRVTGITVHGLGGGDNITIDPSITVPLILYDYDGYGPDSITANGASDTTVTVGLGSDAIHLGNGSDFVFCYGGNDTVVAGNGNDYVQGGHGNCSITLGNGNDVVHAGKGNDSVVLGAGNNTVILNGGNDAVNTGDGSDTILGGSGIDTITTAGTDLLFVRNGDTVNGTATDTVWSNGGKASVTGVPSSNIHTGRPANWAVKQLIYESRV